MTDNPTLSAFAWDGDRAPLAKALVVAQKATESIKKAASNPAFKSKYADLSHVIEGVVPALNAAGLGVMQFPCFDGEMVTVTTMFLHESGASLTSTLHLRPSKSDPQGVGSAITYGRRYALLAMTGAAPEDDDGDAASGPREAPRATAPAAQRVDPTPPAQRDDTAEELASNLIEGCGSREMLQDAWEQNKAGWKGVLDNAAYLRIAGLTKSCLARMTAPEAPPSPPVESPIFDDEIPF